MWEFYSGQDWNDLASETQTAFTDLVGDGPRTLIRGVLASEALLATRATVAPDPTPTPAPTAAPVTFSQVTTVLNAKCAGSGCHSSGTTLGSRYDFSVAATFADAPVTRITDGSMPPAGTALSAAEAQQLVDYINQN